MEENKVETSAETAVRFSARKVAKFCVITVLAVSLGYIHYRYVSQLFENDRNFSYLSELEREMSFRTEMGFYYSYYKTVVEERPFVAGISKLMYDRLVEYPKDVNAFNRFNIHPEVIMGALYRYFEPYLNTTKYRQCHMVDRGEGLAPVESCVGLGQPIFFYLEGIWWLAGLTVTALFLHATALSESILGGLLAVASYFANHAECTRVQWAPNQRENFAAPLLLLQTWLVSMQLRDSRRRTTFQLQLASLYTLGVQVHVAGEDVDLYACYKPPATRLEHAELRALLPPHAPRPALIAGDLNCKHPAWNSVQTNPEGRRLFADAEAHGYTVSGPEVPTHYPDRAHIAPDVLDIVVHSGLTCQITQQVLDDEMQSDHHPVLVVLSGMPTRQRLGAPRRKIDWDAFTKKLEITTPTRPIVSPADVDGLAEEVTVCIQSALDKATTVSPQGATAYPPLPRHLQQLIAQKRRLRKRWQVTRCPTEKAVVNRLAERIKAELNAHRSESWEARIDAVDGDWPSIHRLCRQLSNTPAPVRPLLDSGGALRYTAPDRAEIFAEHLERQFRPNDTQDAEHVAAVEKHLGDYFASPIASEEDPIFFAPGAVRRAILRTKLKKAPGADGITNTALRHLPYRMVAALARLYTGILRTGTFPRIWKEGRVIMLPKAQKNVLKPESYRPITLLPTISKVFELLLLRHLTPHLTPRPEQYGFRAEHSTTLQLTRVLHHFANTVNRREHAVAVFLDMEKAFDRVWHPGLIYKISTSDTPRRITQVISSFLTGRTIRVVVDGALSSARPVRAGVPQGSCLSPICYSRYTDDIPSAEDSTLALYADDAAYITTSMSAKHAIVKMQRVLDLLPEWLSKWRLSVNVGKTQAIIIGGGPARPPKLALQGAEIEWSRQVKYLGVTIDRRLTMAAHVRQVAGKGRVARALLKPVLSSRLPLRTKLAVYKTYIRPVLTYAAPAWFALTSESSRKKLRSQQSACLRLIAQAPRYVRNDVLQRDLKMESLDEFVRRLSEGMFARADASAWLHVKHLAPLHARPPDAKALPRDLLPDVPPTPPD